MDPHAVAMRHAIYALLDEVNDLNIWAALDSHQLNQFSKYIHLLEKSAREAEDR